MFRFEAFEESHFLEFLWQGLLDEYIEEILDRFNLFSPKIQFELILYLRERLKDFFNPKVLAKSLQIKVADAEKIIKGEDKLVEIILAGEDEERKNIYGKVCKALVIPGTSKIITNLSHQRKYLTVLKKLLGLNFAIFFEDSFAGGSFMLPVAVALSVKNMPKDLRFTGLLNTKGDILDVDFLREKVEFAKSQRLRLITPHQVKNLDTIKAYLEKDHWDIPLFITSSGKEEVEKFLSEYQGEKVLAEFELLKGIELFYELSEDNFYLITGQLKTKEDWEKTCEAFYNKFYHIKHYLPGIKTFHLGIRGSASLSFAFGVLFSHFDPFVFYHYQVLEGIPKYHPIPVLTPRKLKERITNYRFIIPTFEKRGEDLVIVLNFSHHEPTADVKSYVAEFLKEPSFLILETEYKGNLPIESLVDVARESASFIQEIRKEQTFKGYHFFFSCPIAIAFMVGLAFGQFVDGWIYNYQKEEALYQPVFDFKFLRKIREKDVRFG